MPKQELLTQEELKKLFDYDAVEGKFIRKSWVRGGSSIGIVKPKDNGNGYLRLCINGKNYYIHRLAWFYIYGEWPKKQIDHINGNRSDNRLINLREATITENTRNRKNTNKSGIKGITPKGKKWAAQITVNYKNIPLGRFDTKELAHKAYCNAVDKYHGEFGRKE